MSKREIYEDSKIQSTMKAFDHGIFEVVFEDGKKESFIARNIFHLTFCISNDSHLFSKGIESIKRTGYAPTGFFLQNNSTIVLTFERLKGQPNDA